MNAHHKIDGEEVVIADSWATSVTADLERSCRIAWIVAGISAIAALLLALAIVIMLPLKTVEPYTLLVDRQTGYVEELAPLERQVVSPDAALTRSFLVQYVIARESYDTGSIQRDYRKVALWSEGDARQRYIRQMQPNNPASPLSYLPRNAALNVDIKSVSSLSADSSLVRFTTTRTDPGGQPQDPQHWAAIINYRFSGAEMTADDRLLNPLGFQVTRYRKDAETLPDPLVISDPLVTPISRRPQQERRQDQ
ncbi:Type IV secretion system protein virB8 [Alteripontixanthobacter maritimus]|uniref:Type IV secretion system protein virB8 n=1 Tax=Alteripontixanthobacter maritimus TaxID=2161824 RepID=A0A369QET4_9SPHN|nr:VirB8/TrbF family protein [Alteripontixanthobacter maritimus]RDC58909.1 Type IV secretion system protein virB8 [Alteripontixanthobacter maritimus]RDC61419.1 Type IV secretion system protein virB8 [Alteripontixanthobacter maritimus]